ncbi:aldo/keto reductase [Flavobacteriales bacterium]|nr:aldo/keto reductase [Flavobacteriales bacterium]
MNQPEIIAGTMNWGVWGTDMSLSNMSRHIEGCLERGVFAFDHADIYGDFTTERAFGQAFAETNVSREQVWWVSKCGIQFPNSKIVTSVKHYNYTPKHIRQSVENSLRNLQTEYLDGFLLHRPSPLMESESIVHALCELREEGKIKGWGVSNFTPSQMELFQGDDRPLWNQLECSVTHTSPMTDGTLDFMKVYKIAAMAWSPLGRFFKISGPQQKRLNEVVARLSEKTELTPAQLLLAWLVRHPMGIIPVVGTTDLLRLSDLKAACSFHIELEDWFAMTEASWGHRVP